MYRRGVSFVSISVISTEEEVGNKRSALLAMSQRAFVDGTWPAAWETLCWQILISLIESFFPLVPVDEWSWNGACWNFGLEHLSFWS